MRCYTFPSVDMPKNHILSMNTDLLHPALYSCAFLIFHRIRVCCHPCKSKTPHTSNNTQQSKNGGLRKCESRLATGFHCFYYHTGLVSFLVLLAYCSSVVIKNILHFCPDFRGEKSIFCLWMSPFLTADASLRC